MTRILYGMTGDTSGHIARVTAITSRLPESEFHFVGGGHVAERLGGKAPVLEVPVLRVVHRNQSVAVARTAGHIVAGVARAPRVCRRIRELIDRWQPHLAICDHAFFLPIAARQAGLPCLSLDHGHVLLACNYSVPLAQRWSWSLAMLQDGLFFNFTRRNLITSFYHPPLKPGRTDELFPPVLREDVRQIAPRDGNHVLCYQTSPTFHQLIHAVHRLPRPVIVYGYRNERATDGNVTFKPYDPRAILEDLAGCAYAVVNGGHNVICEALHFGKPLLCFPMRTHFEQFLNAAHVRTLGYGDYSLTRKPTVELFRRFEQHLDNYRAAIRRGFVDGTEAVVQRLRSIIAEYA
jgi:uncharacterized protein (TIGR00661 family)